MKKKYTYLIVIFLIIASLVAFGRIAGNGFINYDEELYITENDHIKSGINPESIKWAFSAVVCSNWHPLTLLSHSLDWSLFKDNAGGHHFISLLIHIGAVLLLFFFLNSTTKNIWPSAFAAALFALHPLRVESVAWAAERKDVLSMFFGLASIYAYACYAESSKLSRYFLCLIFFVLSLMSKPMLVTLPFVLLLLDYWPLGRGTKDISAPINSRGSVIGRLLWEKVPFIFLAIVSSVVTIWAQKMGGSVASMERLPFPVRISNAITSYVSYLGKTFWPADLAVFYPFDFYLPLWQVLISSFILIVITVVVLYYIKKLPFLFVGWFWYLVTLIPVIGLVQVGKQAMADRYTYLPSIGIAIMLAWGIPLLFPREDIRKKILFPAAIAIITILSVITWQQCGFWKNSIELWNHTLQVTKDNYLAHNNLGLVLFGKGRIKEAIDHYNKALHVRPDYFEAYGNRGNAYAGIGQYQQTIENYTKAIYLKPYHAEGYYTRGTAYGKLLGQYQQAIEDFNKAIALNPDYTKAYNNRGLSYYALGQYQLAIDDFNKAISMKQDYADAYNNRATVYLKQGNNEIGCGDAQKACALGNCKTLEEAKAKGTCF
ncbi:hypothetical protein ASZ90_006231 [hydrocarbon metagenome]|uniref:Uncharacterized protein n=1 Tax=hydrocarbon metagenome TaxID=938273 RepID=A0A0W8FSS3_9ZZZZ